MLDIFIITFYVSLPELRSSGAVVFVILITVKDV